MSKAKGLIALTISAALLISAIGLYLFISSLPAGYIAQAIGNLRAGAGSASEPALSDALQTEEPEAERFLYGDYLKPIKDLEPLPIGAMSELNRSCQDFISVNVLNIGSVLSDRYLGCIDDLYVFFKTSAATAKDLMTACAADSLHIAGYDFFYGTPFSIILYNKSGKTMLLKEAYDSGMIDADTVCKIYQRNNEYIRYFSPELNFQDKKPITDEEFEAVRQAWIKKFGSNDLFADSYEVTNGEHYKEFYFYGWIGNNIVFHAGDPEYTGPNQWVEFDIEENKFTVFPGYMNIWVYRDDEIMLLPEAYEKSIVQFDDLSTISYMNKCICDG